MLVYDIILQMELIESHIFELSFHETFVFESRRYSNVWGAFIRLFDICFIFLCFQSLNEMLEPSTNMNVSLRKINDFHTQYQLETDKVIGWLIYIYCRIVIFSFSLVDILFPLDIIAFSKYNMNYFIKTLENPQRQSIHI
jgi:hypothetical protein